MTDPKELPRKYLGSLLFLALEFFVGGVLTLLIVIASPLWHYPSWTVVELGLVSVAVLATITYWLLRSRDEAQKA